MIFFQPHLSANESESFPGFPVAYQGRFLPAESYSVQYLYDLTHKGSTSKSNKAALDTLWQLHFFGAQRLEDTPFFLIQHQETKEILGLDLSQKRYSTKSLRNSFEEPLTNLAAIKLLLKKHYDKAYLSTENRSGRTTFELKLLSPDLWVQWKDGTLSITAAPQSFPWQHLKTGMPIASDISLPFDNKNDGPVVLVIEEIEKLLAVMLQFEKIGTSKAEDNFNKSYWQLQSGTLTPKEIALKLEQQHPLEQRLDRSGDLFRALPGKFQAGKWYSLHALHAQNYNANKGQLELTQNFTLYSDSLFESIREHYFELEKFTIENKSTLSSAITNEKISELENQLALLLMEGYQNIAQSKYGSAIGKELTYPSIGQLNAERFYSRYPFTILCILGYAITLTFLCLSLFYKRKLLFSVAFFILLMTFVLHTVLLGLRCYILGRPPVTNMLETVLYVPWVTVFISLILRLFSPSPFPLVASSTASMILLVLLQLNFFPTALENVQAVLNSQYWLLIHVLMVVGSYGLFLLSSILGHIYLVGLAYYKRETTSLALVAQSVVLSLYIGVVLLIGGTLLGGVWAAQSWGRFWDWDPKESWAFISICIYLLWIHAYRFGKIQHLGMAIGSVMGFLAISFTWYGVNYILGTGLHSYGFGSGGNFYYYCYLIAELLFLAASVHMFRSDVIKNLDKKTPTC